MYKGQLPVQRYLLVTYMYCTIGTQKHEDGSKEADHERGPLARQVSQVQPEVKDLVRVLMLSKN